MLCSRLFLWPVRGCNNSRHVTGKCGQAANINEGLVSCQRCTPARLSNLKIPILQVIYIVFDRKYMRPDFVASVINNFVFLFISVIFYSNTIAIKMCLISTFFCYNTEPACLYLIFVCSCLLISYFNSI